MAKPLVSVIIPTYNRADYLPRSVFSVLNQSVANIELVIADDGSSDQTEAYVRQIIIFVASKVVKIQP